MGIAEIDVATAEDSEAIVAEKMKTPNKKGNKVKKVTSPQPSLNKSRRTNVSFGTFSCREAYDQFGHIASKDALADKGFNPECLRKFPFIQKTITKL